MQRRLVSSGAAALFFVVAGGCSLLVDTSGLSDGPSGGASDGGGNGDAGIAGDGPEADGPASGEGGSDSGEGCTPPGDPALVVYYPFDETSGSVAHDCSGKGHDGAVIAAPAGGAWGQGLRGGAFVGDGKGCIDLGNPADLEVEGIAFTVAAWVFVDRFTTASNDARYLIGRSRNASFAGWRLAANLDATYLWTYVRGGTRFDLPSQIGQAVKQWTHLAGTYDPSGRSVLYVGGVLAADRVSGGPIDPDTTGLRIGCRADDDLYFEGRIDELRVYRRALSAAEIQALAK